MTIKSWEDLTLPEKNILEHTVSIHSENPQILTIDAGKDVVVQRASGGEKRRLDVPAPNAEQVARMIVFCTTTEQGRENLIIHDVGETRIVVEGIV